MGKWVSAAINNEIPVTPPSINLLGNKKPFNPKAAEKIPPNINATSFINRKKSSLKKRNPLAFL